MSITENPYINLEHKLLLALGAWPFQDPKEIWIRTPAVCIIITSLAGVMVLGYAKECCSFKLIAEVIPVLAVTVAFVGKYVVTYYDAKKLRKLYKHMERDWTSLTTAEERAITEELAEKGRRYNLNFAKVLYCLECGFCLSPFSSIILDIFMPLNESRPFRQLYRVEYYIDQEKYYYLIFFHLYVATTIIITIAVATDVMYLSKVHHARGLFRLAGYRLRLALSGSAMENCIEFERIALFRKIAHGIESHRRAMKFCASIYDVYETSHTLLVIAGLVAITVSMFCAVAFLGQLQEMVMYTVFFAGQICYAFLIMYPVQQMSDESEKIFYEIYSAQWYLAPLASQKIMVTILQKTMTPTKVVYVKLLSISLETFSIIVQTAISYCTLLCSIK